MGKEVYDENQLLFLDAADGKSRDKVSLKERVQNDNRHGSDNRRSGANGCRCDCDGLCGIAVSASR